MSLYLLVLSNLILLLNLNFADALFGIPNFLAFGQCAQPKLKEYLKIEKYQGLWFDILSIPNDYTVAKKCISHNMTLFGSAMTVNTKGLNLENYKVLNNIDMYPSKNLDPIDPAFMIVDSDGVPSAPYKIVATDYVRYSCIYSCLQYSGFKAEFGWVTSRTPQLSKEYKNICQNQFEKMGMDFTSLKSIVQGKECPYYEKIDNILNKNKKALKEILSKEELQIISDQNITSNMKNETLADGPKKMSSNISSMSTIPSSVYTGFLTIFVYLYFKYTI